MWMRERGFKWSQATVWAIEKGDRPLRLAEAWELSILLEQPLESLIRPTNEAVLLRALRTADARIQHAWYALRSAVDEFEAEMNAVRDDAVQYRTTLSAIDWQDTDAGREAEDRIRDLETVLAHTIDELATEMLASRHTEPAPSKEQAASILRNMSME